MTFVIGLLVVVMMLGALAAIPFGVPGVWIMVLLLLTGTFLGTLSWGLWLFLVGLALVAELGEFWILKRMGDHYGASKKAFWGAILGGFLGVLIGTPIPIIGSVVAGFLGTFIGAGIVTLWESRSVGEASRVGLGVLLARTLAIGLKIGVGVVVLLVGGLGMASG
jgi:uncharacterized protein YqgC (DUF456 family)